MENDKVQHPSHYNREGAMECFDEFVLIYGKQAAMYACLFNIHKYRYRAADKNGAEDLAKSDWYLRKYKELKNGEFTLEKMQADQEAAESLLKESLNNYWNINGIRREKNE